MDSLQLIHNNKKLLYVVHNNKSFKKILILFVYTAVI